MFGEGAISISLFGAFPCLSSAGLFVWLLLLVGLVGLLMSLFKG